MGTNFYTNQSHTHVGKQVGVGYRETKFIWADNPEKLAVLIAEETLYSDQGGVLSLDEFTDQVLRTASLQEVSNHQGEWS